MILARKQKDVSFGQNPGAWVGLNSIKKYYHTRTRDELKQQLDKIRKWHLNICAEFDTPFEKRWVQTSEERRAGGLKSGPTVKPDRPNIGCKDYSTRRIQSLGFPKPPEPYRTFTETFSYSPDQNLVK